MSHNLIANLKAQLTSNGAFNLLSEDGATIQAHNLQGLYSLYVADLHGKTLFDGYSDLDRIFNHVKIHNHEVF